MRRENRRKREEKREEGRKMRGRFVGGVEEKEGEGPKAREDQKK